jgi:hypothetical protein
MHIDIPIIIITVTMYIMTHWEALKISRRLNKEIARRKELEDYHNEEISDLEAAHNREIRDLGRLSIYQAHEQ